MDIRDLKWNARPAGNTLIQQIEALGARLNVPANKRKDIRWLAENSRSLAQKEQKQDNRCEHKVLLNYVQTALQQGIDNLSG